MVAQELSSDSELRERTSSDVKPLLVNENDTEHFTDIPENQYEDISPIKSDEKVKDKAEEKPKLKTYRYFGMEFQEQFKWHNLIIISLYHVWFVHSVFYYALNEKSGYTSLWLLGWLVATGVGVTGGAHRLWSHKSYKAKLPLRILLAFLYTGCGMNSIFQWVRDHRVHHKYSDTDADPHNARRGFFFSHVGWLMMNKNRLVIEKGKQVDMSDILNDPVLQFHEKYFIPGKLLLCFILPTAIPMYFWNESFYMSLISQCVIRYLIAVNAVWAVNSAAHFFGTKPFDHRILPVQNRVVAFVGLGEGWHNYHHAFPFDYKTAEFGSYAMNFTAMCIDFFAKIGWAYDLKVASNSMIKNTLKKYGDGTYHGVLTEED